MRGVRAPIDSAFGRFAPSLLPAVAIVVATVALYGSWLTDHGVFTHEASDPYSRTAQLLVELRAGNVPPQLLPDAHGGAGTAFPRYYPPLPFGVSTTLAALTGGDAVLGVNLAFVLGALASGFSMAFVVRRLTDDRRLAAGAALVYLAAPYHLFDVHVRGALGESFAFVWIPLVLYGSWRTIERARFDPLLACSLAGLMLSHTISMLLTGFGVTTIAGVAVARRHWRALAWLGASAVLGVGFAAWFLVPQQLELGDIWANDAAHMSARDADVVDERVGVDDLLGSWRNGFRGYDDPPFVESHAGRCWLFFCGSENHVVGPVALALPVVGIAFSSRDRRRPSAIGIALAISLAVWFAFVLRPNWFLSWLPRQFGYVQFPWRALAPAAAAVAILWALVLRDRRRGGVALLLIGVAAVALVPRAQVRPWERPDVTDACFTRADVRAPSDPLGDRCFESPAGVMPQAVGDPTARDGRGARGFTTGNDYLPMAVDSDDPTVDMIREPVVVAGNATVDRWVRTDDGLVAAVTAVTPSIVRFPATAYSFTRVSSDRGAVERSDRAGTVGVRVQPGTTTIRIARGLVLGDLFGWFLTAASVALSMFLIARGRSRADARAKVWS
jgi:6-pyruvoyl-tetrahydropterin synthase related domain